MKYLTFFLVVGISLSGFCQNTIKKENPFLNRIVACFNQMRVFEGMAQKKPSINFQDSIIKYNRKLISYLSNSTISKLDSSQLLEMSQRTEIRSLKSQDGKLRVVSWCAFIFSNSPMCSNMALIKNAKPAYISINSYGDNDFGNNIEIDTIFEKKYENKFYYILLGSNKCGNLCIQETASVYSIEGNKFVKRTHVLFDGTNFFDDAKFDYFINNKIEGEPSFKIVDGELISPVFNEDKTKIISSKKYKIKL